MTGRLSKETVSTVGYLVAVHMLNAVMAVWWTRIGPGSQVVDDRVSGAADAVESMIATLAPLSLVVAVTAAASFLWIRSSFKAPAVAIATSLSILIATAIGLDVTRYLFGDLVAADGAVALWTGMCELLACTGTEAVIRLRDWYVASRPKV